MLLKDIIEEKQNVGAVNKLFCHLRDVCDYLLALSQVSAET